MLMDLWRGLCVGCVLFFVVLYEFVLDCDVLVLFHLHCIFYYRVPGLHCAGDLIGTWLVCLSTVSFLL